MKKVLGLVMLVVVLASCSRVEPNYEGVLMENYGRNGKSDFKVVTGKQNTYRRESRSNTNQTCLKNP